jgi:hypothetical protein
MDRNKGRSEFAEGRRGDSGLMRCELQSTRSGENIEHEMEYQVMKKFKVAYFTGALIVGAVFSSCLSIGGGDETVHQTQAAPTTGQELMDLKAAYDRGIISEQEYNQQRERLLKGK